MVKSYITKAEMKKFYLGNIAATGQMPTNNNIKQQQQNSGQPSGKQNIIITQRSSNPINLNPGQLLKN